MDYNLPNGSVRNDTQWKPLERYLAYETKRRLFTSDTSAYRGSHTCVLDTILENLSGNDDNSVAQLVAGLRTSVEAGTCAEIDRDLEDRATNIPSLADGYLRCRNLPITLAELRSGLSEFQEAAAWQAARMIYAYYVEGVIADLLEVCLFYGLDPQLTHVTRNIPGGKYSTTLVAIPSLESGIEELTLGRISYIYLTDYTLYLY